MVTGKRAKKRLENRNSFHPGTVRIARSEKVRDTELREKDPAFGSESGAVSIDYENSNGLTVWR